MNDYNSLSDTLGKYKANNNNGKSFYDNLYAVHGEHFSLGSLNIAATLFRRCEITFLYLQPEQIQTEYKKRVLTCHPDRLKLNEDKSAEFHKLLTAYKILSDPTERAQYDKWRNSSIKVPYLMWKGLGAHAQVCKI